MSYDRKATSATPALIIYLLDLSASMSQPLGSKRRIDVVKDALLAAFSEMVYRAARGAVVAPRYRIGILAYSDDVYDCMGGIKTIDLVWRMGIPPLELRQATNTCLAFEKVEKILMEEIAKLPPGSPAPLVCHMTDGEYSQNTRDPEPLVKRIMKMKVPDGNVLVENIFISDSILPRPVGDARAWSGIRRDTPLKQRYAKQLANMSSILPESYRVVLQEYGYNLTKDALMLLPGESEEMVKMGFVMSQATQTTRGH